MEGFPRDDLCKIFHGCQRMAKVPHGCARVLQTDDRWTGDSIQWTWTHSLTNAAKIIQIKNIWKLRAPMSLCCWIRSPLLACFLYFLLFHFLCFLGPNVRQQPHLIVQHIPHHLHKSNHTCPHYKPRPTNTNEITTEQLPSPLLRDWLNSGSASHMTQW